MSGLTLPITASAPADLSNSGDGARLFRELSTALQNQLAPVVVGVFSARPAAGVAGRRYFATDTATVYEDTGSAWLQISTTGAAQTFTGSNTFELQTRLNGGAYAVRPVAADTAYRAVVAGDAADRYQVLADGKIQWGPGGVGGLDTSLYRDTANVLRTNATFHAAGGLQARPYTGTLTSPAISLLLPNETNPRFFIRGDGILFFGSGAAAGDTTLYRESASRLRTDSAFVIGGNVGFYGTAPVAKQAGVAVTAAAIHTALVNLGLIAA